MKAKITPILPTTALAYKPIIVSQFCSLWGNIYSLARKYLIFSSNVYSKTKTSLLSTELPGNSVWEKGWMHQPDTELLKLVNQASLLSVQNVRFSLKFSMMHSLS
jgi:hypothetical protein